MASCSYPGVFSPVEFEGDLLIDGGTRENVPWRELKECGADEVVSIVFQNEIKNYCSLDENRFELKFLFQNILFSYIY